MGALPIIRPWANAGQVSGTASLSLPSDWMELYLVLYLYGDNVSTLYVPRKAVDGKSFGSRAGRGFFMTGVSTAAYASVWVSVESVQRVTYYFNGNVSDSLGVLEAYYR